MDKIIRCITSDGGLMASAIDSSDLVFTAQSLHSLSKTTAAALGRLLTAASVMGAFLKNDKSSLTITINGGGPAGALVARADSRGNVRGYVENPNTELPLRADGKLDVGGVVGHNGRLTVIRDEGRGEPYIAHTKLISGEVAEDITGYYAYSEQIPSFCALGVLTDKLDGKVLLAGGMLVQVLPGADDSVIARLEANTAKLSPVTTMLAQGVSPLDMCRQALEGFAVEILDSFDINYVCNCSKERFSELLLTLPADEIRDLPLVKNGNAEASCQYCSRKYYFSPEELELIAQCKGNSL